MLSPPLYFSLSLSLSLSPPLSLPLSSLSFFLNPSYLFILSPFPSVALPPSHLSLPFYLLSLRPLTLYLPSTLFLILHLPITHLSLPPYHPPLSPYHPPIYPSLPLALHPLLSFHALRIDESGHHNALSLSSFIISSSHAPSHHLIIYFFLSTSYIYNHEQMFLTMALSSSPQMFTRNFPSMTRMYINISTVFTPLCHAACISIRFLAIPGFLMMNIKNYLFIVTLASSESWGCG